MLRDLKSLYRNPLSAFDGEIGHVEDFYFIDQEWLVRYVVVATGAWMPGRQALISVHDLGGFHQDGSCPQINLTRQQIENGPSIDSHKPVSRQHEEQYYRDHGWPYWVGGGIWGIAGTPTVAPPHLMPGKEENGNDNPSQGDDPHLRSTRDMDGYHIQTGDGAIGRVADFMIDDGNWSIRHLVVATGRWFSGKEIVISPAQIARISYEQSAVFVNLTRETIREAPEHHAPPPSATHHDYEIFDD